MSIEAIFRLLEQLIALHRSLNELSILKTVFLKEGRTEELQQILFKERKVTHSLEMTEQRRQQAVQDWMKTQGVDKEGTVTELLNISNETDQEKLAELSALLIEEIKKLKQNEQLNQALLEQSLQFVRVSLDLMNPTLKNINYGKQSESYSSNRSVFDSKA